MTKKTLLLSIHPEHANNIFEGTKTIELRRVLPRLSKGDQVFVYVSSPTKALVGTFDVEHVIEDNPDKLWNKVKAYAAITKKVFTEYYTNTEKGYGIVISKARKLKKSVDLDTLRRKFPNFHPPQGYRYLNDLDIQRIGESAQYSIK